LPSQGRQIIAIIVGTIEICEIIVLAVYSVVLWGAISHTELVPFKKMNVEHICFTIVLGRV
jgi:hypothetical protein